MDTWISMTMGWMIATNISDLTRSDKQNGHESVTDGSRWAETKTNLLRWMREEPGTRQFLARDIKNCLTPNWVGLLSLLQLLLLLSLLKLLWSLLLRDWWTDKSPHTKYLWLLYLSCSLRLFLPFSFSLILSHSHNPSLFLFSHSYMS